MSANALVKAHSPSKLPVLVSGAIDGHHIEARSVPDMCGYSGDIITVIRHSLSTPKFIIAVHIRTKATICVCTHIF